MKGKYLHITRLVFFVSVSCALFISSGAQAQNINKKVFNNEMSVNSTENVSIYAEEVEGLVVAKFQVKYNASMLSLDTASVSKGEMFLGVTDILFFTEEIGSGLLDVNLSVLGHDGVSGTGELIRLPFIPKATGTSTIEILNAEYSNITPSSIPIVDSANGLVVIQ